VADVGTYAETKSTVERLAADAFARHVLTQEGPGEWRCGREGTVIHSSRVLLRPGMVAVWGDLGEWILRHGDRDSLGWLRGAVKSPDYLLEKVRAGKRSEFYPDDALAWLRSDEAVEAYGKDRVAKAREALEDFDSGPFSQDRWFDACYGAACMDDPPRFEYPCASALWLVALLRKFVALEAAEEVNRG